MPRSSRPSESTEGVCPVCSETINIFAVGMCDHPVCYICLTRMRVLCDQLQCVICRVELPKVVFLKNSVKYAETDTSNFQVFRKHKIYFENQSIQDEFYELLDHACHICDQKKFRTFAMLRDHMRREHQLNYCDLCVSHLKVFSHERKCYDRTRLGLHRRVGDEDDKGHKGHPLCEFCDERFLDNDELVRHLRTEHYFCHFCDADGITNQFYSEYSFLREHFKEGHYLCEEGECNFVEFTNAFRSDIDLKAHFATDHINRMKKSQARQARTLDIGFNLTPREGGGRRDRDWDRDRDRDRDRGNRDRDRNRNQERDRDQGRPSRGRQNGGSVVTGDDYEEVNRESQGRGGRGRGRGRGRGGYSRDQREAEKEAEETVRAVNASLAETHSVPQNKDFPSLDGKIVDNAESKPEAVRHDPAQSTPDNMATYVARNSNFSIRDGGMGAEDFPSLGGPNRASNSDGNSAWAFKPTNKDFPALGQPQKPKARPASTTWQSKPAAVPAPAAYQVTAPYKRPQTVPTASRPPPSLSSIGSVLLSSSKSNVSVANNTVRQSSSSYNSNSFNASEVEDFPSLGGSKPPQQQTGAYTASKSSSKKKAAQVKPTVNAKTVTAMFDEEFPTLGGKRQPSQQLPMPTPSLSKQNAPKPDDVESIALRKLQNQQMRLERDSYKLPEKEPEQEWTVKPVSEKAKKQEQEKVKKLAAKSQASPEVSRREEGSSKVSKSQGATNVKSSQQKKPMDDKAKKPSAESADNWQTSQGDKSQDIKKKKKAEKLDDDFPSLGGKPQAEKLSSDQWQVPQAEKTQEKKKKKKVEKFEDDFPSLDGKPVDGSSFEFYDDQWQKPQVEKKQEKKKTKKVEKFEDDFPTLAGKPVKGSSFDDQWQTSQVEKKQEKNNKKKVENFEDDFPTLGGKPASETTVKLEWGQKENKNSTESTDEMTKLKIKKKNKKEKNEANKVKVESEPEPTWGYVPDFVAPVVSKEKRKAPPGIVYKENKENKRDEKQPWGDTTPIDETDAPSLFKVPNEDLYGGIAGALKDQSNLTLASLTANLKGFSISPVTPITIKEENLIDDFPSLGGASLPIPPPGLGFPVPQAKPPPGFSTPGGINDAPVIAAPPPVAKPPPGFSAPTITPVATDIPVTIADPPAPNDLPIEYQKPNHFMDRNISLISAVEGHLGDNEEKFMRFKKSSGQFRQGRMSGSEYYAQCNNIIGPDGFREIFSELLVLLPDIDKQHELLAAYNEARQPQRGMTTKKEKEQRKAWATLDSIFTTCPTCRQVLVDRDVADHGTEHHMDNDFPTLGATPGNQYGFSAWVKGN